MVATATDQRAQIERALRDPLVRVPASLQPGFFDFQNRNRRRFLLLVNLLGQGAYLSYALADWLVVPDIAALSFSVRSLYVGLVTVLTLALFRWSRDIRWLDLLLPVSVLGATVLWFELLARTASPNVATYQYAALIFIVLANLCVQVCFLPSLLVSLLISATIVKGVAHNSGGDANALAIFMLAYLPVLFFSLFISWSATHDRRRAYLRHLLDEMNRRELSAANQALERMAHTDGLTGLCNRRQFERLAERELARASRQCESLCLLLFDVDHFKRINDSHGHDMGDQVLRAISRTAQGAMREHDLLARFGGEEFIALLPKTDLDQALVVAERLRNAIAGCWDAAALDAGMACTVSIGVARSRAGESDLPAMIKDADKALYQAKQAGRNQVCLAFGGVGAIA
ncbi:MAG: hypothetical protein RJA36_71 [Pseudomonadota bacterium]|jgi:diguanylate cyclase (GGDEF)-like protein